MALTVPHSVDFNEKSLSITVERAEKFVEDFIAEVDSKIDEKVAKLEELQQRIDTVSSKLDNINSDTVLEYPSEFPSIDFVRTKFKGWDLCRYIEVFRIIEHP